MTVKWRLSYLFNYWYQQHLSTRRTSLLQLITRAVQIEVFTARVVSRVSYWVLDYSTDTGRGKRTTGSSPTHIRIQQRFEVSENNSGNAKEKDNSSKVNLQVEKSHMKWKRKDE